MKKRPSIDEYFLKFAMLAAERSTCLRHNIGAIIVRDKHIISTGYNGAPKSTRDCIELGCLRDELKIPSGTQQQICRAVHAEQNAIIQAAYHGNSIKGATMYCTHSPCIICAKMIVNSGISKLITYSQYHDDSFVSLFLEAGVKYEVHKKPESSITELDKVMLYENEKNYNNQETDEAKTPQPTPSQVDKSEIQRQINEMKPEDTTATGDKMQADMPL